MNLSQINLQMSPWGILSFDCAYQGLPSQTYNLLRSANKEVGYTAVGHFIKAGLDLDERVALVSFDHPKYLFPKFKAHGFSFDEALAKEELLYFYYKSRFSYALSFATSYRKVFAELENLAKVNLPRIVFLYADVLFNLETHLLAKASVERILASFASSNSVVLGCYQAVNFRAHNILDEVSHESLMSYMELRKNTQGNTDCYNLILHKFPTLYRKAEITLKLSAKYGLNTPAMELVNHG